MPPGPLVQALNLADRRILDSYVTRAEVGVYQMGSNFASAMKFPLSAFEPAWQPFVFDRARRENGAMRWPPRPDHACQSSGSTRAVSGFMKVC